MTYKYLIPLLFFAFNSFALAAGWIDQSSYNHYKGWACEKGNDNPVGIHIWRADGVFLGGGNASNHREQGVAVACGTAGANHGFSINLDIPPNLIDNKYHKVNIYLITDKGPKLLENSPIEIVFGSFDPNFERPTTPGTIVGRDLDIGFSHGKVNPGAIGHIGIWDGRQVIEMLNEGDKNKAKRSSWENFISRTRVWPKAIPRFPSSRESILKPGIYAIEGCFDYECLSPGSEMGRDLLPPSAYATLDPRAAIVSRAYQIHLIGSKYTLTAFPSKAIPGRVWWSSANCNPFASKSPCPKKFSTEPTPGIYRCDTLVLDAFATSALNDWGSSVDAKYRVYDAARFKEWHSRMNILANSTTRSPFTIMHALRSIQ